MNRDTDCTIRRMDRSEAAFAVEQAAKEGWNPGLEDGRVFYETDPNGFFIALLKDRPAGCVSAVSYGADFGFIGFFIVLKEFRGRGYGISLGKAALEYLGKVRTIGVDGVLEQKDNYEKAGFVFAYSNIRYEYKAQNAGPLEPDPAIVPAANIDPKKLLACDRQCFPADRGAFLRNWLSMKNAEACGWLEGDRLKGYGVIRRCKTGYKVGPLFADDETFARGLFSRLCARVPAGENVYLDVPEVNGAGMKIASDLGMRPVFKTARMYRGPRPEIRLDKVFGVTSFELG